MDSVFIVTLHEYTPDCPADLEVTSSEIVAVVGGESVAKVAAALHREERIAQILAEDKQADKEDVVEYVDGESFYTIEEWHNNNRYRSWQVAQPEVTA